MQRGSVERSQRAIVVTVSHCVRQQPCNYSRCGRVFEHLRDEGCPLHVRRGGFVRAQETPRRGRGDVQDREHLGEMRRLVVGEEEREDGVDVEFVDSRCE